MFKKSDFRKNFFMPYIPFECLVPLKDAPIQRQVIPRAFISPSSYCYTKRRITYEF